MFNSHFYLRCKRLCFLVDEKLDAISLILCLMVISLPNHLLQIRCKIVMEGTIVPFIFKFFIGACAFLGCQKIESFPK